MSVLARPAGLRGQGFVLTRRPVPIVVDRGSLVPVVMLAGLFAVYSAGARPLFLLGAAVLGGLGGGASLIVHELGHVRAARRLKGVRPVRVSLLWAGAGTQFEGAYRSGRDQAKVAIAGPAASFAFALMLLVGAFLPMPRPLQYGVFGLGLLNVAIATFSLLPVYPLDGHKLVVGLLWRVAGSERRAKGFVRLVGKAWLCVEAVACVVLAFERPILGGALLVLAGALYAQKRITGSLPTFGIRRKRR